MESTQYSRTQPFNAPLLTRAPLTGAGSSKQTLHIRLGLAGSGLTYAPGDAIGVYPENNPALVADILSATGFTGEEPITNEKTGTHTPLRAVLQKEKDLCTLSWQAVGAYAPLAQAEAALQGWLADTVGKAAFKAFAGQGGEAKQFLNFIEAFPLNAGTSAQAFAACLRKMPARLYSIASSMAGQGGAQGAPFVDLCVGVVRYTSAGQPREGVCSTYLEAPQRLAVHGAGGAEHEGVPSTVRAYVHPNKRFRLPADVSKPLILIGPGTGIAPYRAFLQQRAAEKLAGQAVGPVWLFFGERNSATDFLYQAELEAFGAQGVLTELTTAFSRDQAEKVYVQQRLLEASAKLKQWIAQQGAYVYVCGDAQYMAPDVHAALASVLGGEAALKTLQKEKRYLRDVY